VTEQGRSLVTYGYDAADQRILRTETAGAKTSLILYDEAGHWLADYDSAGKITRQAVWMDNYLVGLVDNGKLLYIEPDHLGSPRAVIDPVRKATLWRWRPSDDPFGTALPDEDPDADGARFVFDLRFPGQRYDAVTGLYYNYFRDYDAASGRYVQADPIGLAGGINPYLYANGSPLRHTDPSGEFAFVGAVIGAAVEAAVQAYDNYSNGCDLLDYHNYSFTNIGIAAAGGAFAPGWLSVGKKAFTSGKAISKLASQFRRSQTVNRLVKIDSRIVAHEEAIKDLLVPQLGIQATSAVFKKIYGAGGDACGCRQ